MRQVSSFLCLITVLFWTVAGVLPHHHHHPGDAPCLLWQGGHAHGHAHACAHLCAHPCAHVCAHHPVGACGEEADATPPCHAGCTDLTYLVSAPVEAPQADILELGLSLCPGLLCKGLGEEAAAPGHAPFLTWHIPPVLGVLAGPCLEGQGLRGPPSRA